MKIEVRKDGKVIGFVENETWAGKFIVIGDFVVPREHENGHIWADISGLTDEEIRKIKFI